MSAYFPVPEKFYGSGSIRIKGIKEIKVTDEYLGLNSQTKGCQNETTYEDCVTELYLDLLKDECKCLPFNLQNFTKQEVLMEFNPIWPGSGQKLPARL